MKPINEELKSINWGKSLFRVLELVIIQPFTLPVKIYLSSLKNLSNAKSEEGEATQLSNEFPIYVWLVSIFDAIIFFAYPIGIFIAIRSLSSYLGSFGLFMAILLATYFSPLYLSLIKEFAQLSLKALLYLKIIALKNNAIQKNR